MGLFQDKSDKTEKATPKRLSDARNKGQVAKSAELGMAMLFLLGLILVEAGGGSLIEALKEGLRQGFSLHVEPEITRTWAVETLRTAILRVAPGILIMMAILVATALVTGFAQVGIKFTIEPIRPKLEKLNPIAGLGRMFQLRSVMQTGLAFLKFVVLFGILWFNIQGDLPVLLTLADMPFAESAPIVAELAIKIFWWIAIVLLLLGILDLIYQKWQHQKDMRMSKQDIKDEAKSTDGDPEIKARIKRAMREVSRRRMMEEVPKADVVITNPTHFAVALKYEKSDMAAPSVVAKGADEVAFKIRELAKENKVPIMEDPPLARALFSSVRLGDEIPRRFYEAVAAVLARVLRMKQEAR
ncbi:MAG: flagellar biosynthesis protein FlhB [Planctomycetota bacterium]|nr:MAG: flagellar biosynthesis protein FlhB [Planctomycetota bacterium]